MGIKIEKVNSREYKLTESIEVVVNKSRITVYEGFIFDGASVPRVLWNIIGSPFTGKYTLASLIHDALYRSESLKRKECDEIFLEIMKKSNVNYIKRYAMYYGVRASGGLIWRNHSVEEVSYNKNFIRVQK